MSAWIELFFITVTDWGPARIISVIISTRMVLSPPIPPPQSMLHGPSRQTEKQTSGRPRAVNAEAEASLQTCRAESNIDVRGEEGGGVPMGQGQI